MRDFVGGIDGTAFGRGIAAAQSLGHDTGTDYRSALCRWEDDLFAEFPAGHQILAYDDARMLIREVFRVCGRPTPSLRLVPGFDDPSVGGFADIARNCIVIEDGFLYRYLILHECAHILVPHDRHHGPLDRPPHHADRATRGAPAGATPPMPALGLVLEQAGL